jgi:hypothetical protein
LAKAKRYSKSRAMIEEEGKGRGERGRGNSR